MNKIAKTKFLKTAVLLFVLALGFSTAPRASAQSAYPYAKPVPNDSVTGATQFTLTKINSSGNAVIMGTSDVNGYSGVCVANCGKTGTAWVAFAGLVPLIVDGTATIDHYITISSTLGGDGHDTGAITYPASGAVIGRIQTGSTGAGSVSMIDLFSAEVVASSAGNSPAAPTNSIQTNAGGGLFGAVSNTVVVNGGSGTIGGLTLAAHSQLLVAANDTETAVKNVSVANLTVECIPGISIQQTTASTDMFFLTTGGNNFTAKNCSGEMPASGTMGVWLDTDPANPVNYITTQNLTLNGLSSTATNSSKGWINISGGSHHRIDANDPFSDEMIVVVDNQTPATHNQIDDVKVTGNYIVNADGKFAFYNLNQSLALASTRLDVNETCSSVGGCVSVYGNNNSENSSIQGNMQWTPGSSGSSHLLQLQCDFCNVGPLVLYDGGAGGNHSNKSLMSVSNGVGKNLHDLELKLGLNNVGPPIIELDDHGNNWHGVTINGPGGSKTVLNPTSGWSTSQPAFLSQIDNTANISSDDVFSDWNIGMPPSSTADAMDFTCSFSAAICDRQQLNTIKAIGQGSTGAGIKFTNTGGGGSSSTHHTIGGNVTIQSFTTGISLGANVNNSVITPHIEFIGVTTPISDSGSNNSIQTLTFTTTGTLSGGTLTVTFPDSGFSTGSSYNCTVRDTTTPANAVTLGTFTATTVIVTGTGTDNFTLTCSGR